MHQWDGRKGQTKRTGLGRPTFEVEWGRVAKTGEEIEMAL